MVLTRCSRTCATTCCSRALSEGTLDLTFRCDARGRTVLQERRQRFPLRMTVPMHLDPAVPEMPFVYVQNPTGGVFDGDRLRLSVRAAEGARAHLTSQSATKLYRMVDGEALQDLRFNLRPGAYVEHVPELLIPQRGARYRQRTTVELEGDAALVTAESVSPGRRAHGERFAFDVLELRTNAWHEGREVCAETLLFEPARARPARPGVLSDGDYLVTMLAFAPARDTARLAYVVDRALMAAPGVIGATGELPNGAGVLARVVAQDAPGAQRGLRIAWGAARRELIDAPLPPVRK
jgi:urease accessory protein